MSELQAVFWDMDGTLVDTEPYWIEAEHTLVTAHGGTWSEEKAQHLTGQALPYSAAVLQGAGVQMSIGEIIDHLVAEVVQRCAQRIPWRPGARDLLEQLHRDQVRSAMVTMSFPPLARAVADALPAGHLEFLVTGDMVAAGKPDPEAYHLAFDTMAADHETLTGAPLSRQQCVAIEDSVPGTAAAAASGLVTVAVPHLTPLPTSGQWHVLETLVGTGPADLQQLLVREPSPAAV
ncbi:HAD family hydrolase [Nesterenkonia sphaerica]|nr:HAD family hydrolase [Nesterenkonia sphaerica]